MNTTLTNKQIHDSLMHINILLGNISVNGEDVFTMADCRNALKQIISLMPVEEAVEDKENKKK